MNLKNNEDNALKRVTDLSGSLLELHVTQVEDTSTQSVEVSLLICLEAQDVEGLVSQLSLLSIIDRLHHVLTLQRTNKLSWTTQKTVKVFKTRKIL